MQEVLACSSLDVFAAFSVNDDHRVLALIAKGAGIPVLSGSQSVRGP